MSLITLLNEKYPVSPFLIFPSIRKKIYFEYSDGFDSELKRHFENGLHDLSVDMALSDQTITLEETVYVSSEEDKIVFRLSNGCTYRFCSSDPLNSMLWTAYSLASCNGWLPETGDNDIIVRAFNISSQRAASNVLYSILNKFEALPDEYSFLKKVISEFTERFIWEAPQFSTQTVTENGWEFIQNATGLLKRKQIIRLYDLCETLFGQNKSFEKELTEYGEYLSSGSEKYRKQLLKAANKCMEAFYSSPVFHLKEAVLNARNTIVSENDYSDDISSAKEKLRTSRPVKDIRPELLSRFFADVNDDYKKASDKIVRLQFLNDLTDILVKRIDSEFKLVIDNLKTSASELSNYCVLNPSDYGIDLKWNRNGEFESDSIVVKDAEWKPSEVQDAQIHAYVPEGFITRVWFAGDDVSNVAQGSSLEHVEPLKSLDKQLLCVVYSKANTSAERVL